MKKKKKFKINKSVQTYVWAVILVVTIPALYIVLFMAKANKEAGRTPSTVQGYVDEETCEQESKKECYQVTTVQEDRYFIPTY